MPRRNGDGWWPRPRLLDGEARALLDRLDIPVGGDVVDIGCGPVGILPAAVGPRRTAR